MTNTEKVRVQCGEARAYIEYPTLLQFLGKHGIEATSPLMSVLCRPLQRDTTDAHYGATMLYNLGEIAEGDIKAEEWVLVERYFSDIILNALQAHMETIKRPKGPLHDLL